MKNQLSKSQTAEVFSAENMLFTTGILGFFLPFILFFVAQFSSCATLQNSISTYYYTNVSDLFVGILSTIAIMFFCYNGYDIQDKIATWIASISTLGIAIFPTSNDATCGLCDQTNIALIPSLHFAFAGILFSTLAYMCLFLFTKSNGNPSPSKLRRNLIYKICGGTILVMIIFLICYWKIDGIQFKIGSAKPIFFAETMMLMAFGFAWLVKGELKWFKD
jgi:hypothetical protein